ncbi:hypothetical protein FKZ61_012420 [Litorilinea aerophila]|uniref:Uncharacterized protein n=1 Tax=Litorilinea aerophila TaxID=1204385 RepID=A0A540VF54_9CHLR|nr:hypothetical protein [Litorilinea aerophila]MCC9076909.1 hypothetical protein [Litorilinea aerophila]
MDPFSPILDQPQVIDQDELDPEATYQLANQDVVFTVDANTDLLDLFWPWADEFYARRIQLRISSPPDDEPLMKMATRYYPGYQESILGSEGVIVSKRLAVPLGSNYDRSVLWMLECQAEGDRLLRLEVEIDWGQPLTQRMVDGLLVAQMNPGRAQGIYAQHNADSTRVFGNPYGRPSAVELSDEGRALLIYYVLVNGIVEVPLVLTISDVGEQVAWNGFLSLRDAERAFEQAGEAWSRVVKTGRLWTSDPRLNRALQVGRLTALRHVQRLRTGLAPSDRRVESVPGLVRCLDAHDLVLSRNLLAHLRRVAERSQGRLPTILPLRAKEAPADPGLAVTATNRAYLAALHGHIQRHGPHPVLADHYEAVQVCVEALILLRRELQEDGPRLADVAVALQWATQLASWQGDSVNAARWESEAQEYSRLARATGVSTLAQPPFPLDDWVEATGWQMSARAPWHFSCPEAGIALAGAAIWQGCGLRWQGERLAVSPTAHNSWTWWALLEMPWQEGSLSLVWDGEVLYATGPVESEYPVVPCGRIRALGAGEFDFDLQFEITPAPSNGESPTGSPIHFRPHFDRPTGQRNQ